MVFKQLQALFESGANKIKDAFSFGKKGLTLSEKTANKLIEIAHLILEVLEETEEAVEELKEDAEELLEKEEE